MSQESPAILWLRQDLRLEDNPALQAAASHPFFAIYILDEDDPWRPGGAGRWWLYRSLKSLQKSFEERGVQLVLRRGKPLEVIKNLVRETTASAVYWNRCYEPYAVSRDQEIKTYLKEEGILCESFKGSLLAEPWEVKTTTKGPYKVFTPFWNALKNLSMPHSLAIVDLKGVKTAISSDSLEQWRLNPTLWGEGLKQAWEPGEKGAQKRVQEFLEDDLDDYVRKRDFPSESFTSRLSPHLHWGEISPAQLWRQASQSQGPASLSFLRQLGWRDFSYHLLFHFPRLPTDPLRVQFAHFPWIEDGQALQAWQKGRTGYPLVDAGMRELWHTGWMHNRVRMLVASFLVKHLLIPWQKGEAWFWDTLVDADLANNAVSWQWVAGCGADAAPYFRIFNPVLQSQKFDPNGVYIKKWVPELRDLDAPYIHAPWDAPRNILEKAGVNLGNTYPCPLIDHAFARKRALEALKSLSV